MLYVGIDHHKKYCYGTVMDEKGQIQWSRKFETEKEKVKEVFNGIGEAKAVLEAGRNWAVMYDWLEEMFDDVVLAHPKKVKAIAEAKIKNDKIDSRTLAHLLRADLIPEAHVPDKETRGAKRVLRQRMFFVRLRTMVKNRIRIMLEGYPEVIKECPVKGMFTGKGLRWLREVSLKGKDREILDGDISMLEELSKGISSSDGLIEELEKEDKDAGYLKSISGIGKFFAVLISKEIDGIERFRTEKKLASYAGLVPSTYSSGQRTVHGRITKQGNKWLRYALIEAVWPAIKADKRLREYYQRLKEGKNANVAKVSCARRLLKTVWRVLKEKKYYQNQIHRQPSCSPWLSADGR